MPDVCSNLPRALCVLIQREAELFFSGRFSHDLPFSSLGQERTG